MWRSSAGQSGSSRQMSGRRVARRVEFVLPVVVAGGADDLVGNGFADAPDAAEAASCGGKYGGDRPKRSMRRAKRMGPTPRAVLNRRYAQAASEATGRYESLRSRLRDPRPKFIQDGSDVGLGDVITHDGFAEAGHEHETHPARRDLLVGERQGDDVGV